MDINKISQFCDAFVKCADEAMGIPMFDMRLSRPKQGPPDPKTFFAADIFVPFSEGDPIAQFADAYREITRSAIELDEVLGRIAEAPEEFQWGVSSRRRGLDAVKDRWDQVATAINTVNRALSAFEAEVERGSSIDKSRCGSLISEVNLLIDFMQGINKRLQEVGSESL